MGQSEINDENGSAGRQNEEFKSDKNEDLLDIAHQGVGDDGGQQRPGSLDMEEEIKE